LNVRATGDYCILLLYLPENFGKETKYCTIFLLQGKDLASRAGGRQNASSLQQEAHKPGKAGFGPAEAKSAAIRCLRGFCS
jgi:hypothetical protein